MPNFTFDTHFPKSTTQSSVPNTQKGNKIQNKAEISKRKPEIKRERSTLEKYDELKAKNKILHKVNMAMAKAK
jgi:hypothetical protein